MLRRRNNQPAAIGRFPWLERFPNTIDAPLKVVAQITIEDLPVVAKLHDYA